MQPPVNIWLRDDVVNEGRLHVRQQPHVLAPVGRRLFEPAAARAAAAPGPAPAPAPAPAAN